MNLLKRADKTVSQLNKIIIKWEKEYRKNYILRFFIGENNYQTVRDILSTITPYGKVCAMFSTNYYNEYGKIAENSIVKGGVKVISLIGEGSLLSVENASKLFNLPDDIKALVIFNSEYIELASYYCSIKSIPLIFNCSEVLTKCAIPTTVNIVNGDKKDEVKVEFPRYIVFDKLLNNCDLDVPETYIDNTSKAIDLIDYRLRGAMGATNIDIYAYTLSRNAVLGAYSVVKDREFQPSLFTVGLKNQVANYMTNGELFSYSALDNARKIVGNSCGVTVEILSRLLGVYYLTFTNIEENNLLYPNYLDRADELSEFGFKTEETLKYMKSQSIIVKENRANIKAIISDMLEELKSQNSVMGNIRNTFIALGGKKYDNIPLINKAIKLCGDIPNTLNGMTIVRESGYGEYIK